jgi:RHS repeat-associated protein
VGDSNAGTLVESWDGATWSIQPSPNPVSNGIQWNGRLFGVSCASTNSCAAVGTYDTGVSTARTLVLTWNGISWSILPSQDAGAFNELWGVSCFSPISCFGAGYFYNQSGAYKTLVETWNGSSWSIVLSPNPVVPAGVPISPNEMPAGFNGAVINSPACQDQQTHCPIDTATGTFWHTFDDLSIPGRGMAIDFTRTYSTVDAAVNGPLGFGWTSSYRMSLAQDATTGNVTIAQEDGAQVTFVNGAGGYAPAAPRFNASLVKNVDGSFTFIRNAQQTFNFSSSGQLTSETDLNAYTTTLTYDATGQLVRVTDPAGRSLAMSYSAGLLRQLTDPLGRTVTFGYNDGLGNLTDVTDVNSGTWHFTYDSAHRIVTMTDPRGGVVTNHYDSGGRADWQTDALGRRTSFAYIGANLAGGGSTTITDPGGNVTIDSYQNGLLVSQTRGAGTAAAATWMYDYDPVSIGRTSVRNPDGHTTTSTYDSNGNLLSVTDPLGHTATYTYNTFNEALTQQDALGVTTTYSYDAYGNLTQVSRPLVGTGQVQTTVYHHADPIHPGDVTSMTDPAGKTWTYTYDTNGYQSSVTDPIGDETASAFNSVGWLLTVVSPKGNISGCGCATKYTTAFGYVDASGHTDEFGDVISVTDPLGHTTVKSYDAHRNLASIKDPNSNTTTYIYDLDNELIQTRRADGTSLLSDYNPDGTVHDQKDGKGNAIQTYGYDSLARVTSVRDALGNVTSYTYDGSGNQLTKQDPGGDCRASRPIGCTVMTYDVANELTSVNYSDGKTPNVTGITYDGDGQRTSLTDGTGTSSWTWDSLHRLTSYTDGAGAKVQYQYDLRNLVVAITYPGSGHVVTRSYDDTGRWIVVTDWLGNTSHFAYDADGNLIMTSVLGGVVDTSTYDAADRLIQISDVQNGSNVLFTATYGRGPNNQLTSDTSVASSVGSFKYTALNQLCYAGSSNSSPCTAPPSGTSAYAYDTADNLVRTVTANQTGIQTQAFNVADELCWTAPGVSASSCGSPPAGATIYTHDTRGNRTSATPSVPRQPANQSTPTAPGSRPSSRLPGVSPGSTTVPGVSRSGVNQGPAGTPGARGANPGPGSLTYDQANRLTAYNGADLYSYNADGLRMTRQVAGAAVRFTWDTTGMLPMLIEQATNSGVSDYIYGPGALPIEQVTAAGVQFFHHDQLGSTRLLTDSSGSTVATYAYDPYGNQVTSSGSFTTNLKFQGQYLDSESGLYYLRARYYDPTTAQFLTVDPALASTRSPYAYAAGNPLNASDPSGKCLGWIWHASDCQWDPLQIFQHPLDAIQQISETSGAGASVLSSVSVACAEFTGPEDPACGLTAAGALGFGAFAFGSDTLLASQGRGSPVTVGLDVVGLATGTMGHGWFNRSGVSNVGLGLVSAVSSVGAWVTALFSQPSAGARVGCP